MNRNRMDDHLNSDGRKRDSENSMLFPESNVASGFTMRGLFILLSLIGVFLLVRFIFF